MLIRSFVVRFYEACLVCFSQFLFITNNVKIIRAYSRASNVERNKAVEEARGIKAAQLK
jgi:hypothetical protein